MPQNRLRSALLGSKKVRLPTRHGISPNRNAPRSPEPAPRVFSGHRSPPGNSDSFSTELCSKSESLFFSSSSSFFSPSRKLLHSLGGFFWGPAPVPFRGCRWPGAGCGRWEFGRCRRPGRWASRSLGRLGLGGQRGVGGGVGGETREAWLLCCIFCSSSYLAGRGGGERWFSFRCLSFSLCFPVPLFFLRGGGGCARGKAAKCCHFRLEVVPSGALEHHAQSGALLERPQGTTHELQQRKPSKPMSTTTDSWQISSIPTTWVWKPTDRLSRDSCLQKYIGSCRRRPPFFRALGIGWSIGPGP